MPRDDSQPFRYPVRKRVLWGVFFALFVMLSPLFVLDLVRGNAGRPIVGLLVATYLGFRFLESLTRYVLDREGIREVALWKERFVAWSDVARVEARYRRKRPVETVLLDDAETVLLKLDHALIDSEGMLDAVEARLAEQPPLPGNANRPLDRR